MPKDYGFQAVMKDLLGETVVFVVPLADLHVGSRDCAEDVINGYVDWIAKTPNAYTILNGDLMNCAGKDTAPELFEDLVTPDMSFNRLVVMLEPIKDKILMITRGGHEEQIFRKAGADYMARLAHELGDLPYKPDGGIVGIRMGPKTHTTVFWLYATHGYGASRTVGSKVGKIEELSKIAEADVFILSHDHTQNIHRLNVLVPPYTNVRWDRPVNMVMRRKLLINTGGFVRYSGYIQRKGYLPQDLGTPRIRLEAKKGHSGLMKDLHASI